MATDQVEQIWKTTAAAMVSLAVDPYKTISEAQQVKIRKHVDSMMGIHEYMTPWNKELGNTSSRLYAYAWKDLAILTDNNEEPANARVLLCCKKLEI